MAQVTRKLLDGCSNLGTMNAIVFLWKAHVLNRLYARQGEAGHYRNGTLRTKQLPRSLTCRYGSTDFKVFNQIYFQDEYGPLKVSHDARLIIDCGAYVGYSTIYFLTKYPTAEVIAVEPDRGNFEALTGNLAHFGNRVKTINSALWSHPARLKVDRGARGEWSNTVRECEKGEPADLEAVDVPSIIARSRHTRVDILKLDIEGAERVVFSRNFESWIDKVDTFVIELHGDDCRETFLRALKGGDFDFSESGELTIARRRARQ